MNRICLQIFHARHIPILVEMYLAFNHSLVICLYACICPPNTSCPFIGCLQSRIGFPQFCIEMVIGLA